MSEMKFDRYYNYTDLTALLHQIAQAHSNLVSIESIGKSYEGRDIWLVTVTNFETGPADEKPAVWVDGNIHASELTGSTACLYHLNHLIEGYGSDEQITHCLDTRTFYICPRIGPDGAEWAMADTPKIIRSSTRPYPFDEEPIEGLVTEDIDGDGRILTMRVGDSNGGWKAHADDPRLMVRRDPIERGGVYYRLLPEGRLTNYDGVNIKVLPNKEGLDLNRNFPMDWKPHPTQMGAGPYPTSEPEVRAVVEFITTHNNIGATIAFHTHGGVILRAFSASSDDTFPPQDLWTYQKLGKKGTELTGYPTISIFHEFKYHPTQDIAGGFDWTYDYLGMFFWAVEVWAPLREAGIEDYKYIDWYRDHDVEDDLKIMKWLDTVDDGNGFVDWYPFNHPELGEVELGGINGFKVWSNPPSDRLEAEVSKFPEWLLWQALTLPQLTIRDVAVNEVGAGAYKVSAVVENVGWLPTYVTQKALQRKMVRGISCEIELPAGATLQSGKSREDKGQLEGRAYKGAFPRGNAESSTDRMLVEWIIQAPEGGEVTIIARHDRAGVVRAQAVLS